MAVLVDTTKCMGCRMCELACAKQNELPEPESKVDFSVRRRTDDTRYTVVNQYETSRGTVSVKTQCFHCLTPACASACLTKAMYKTSSGPGHLARRQVHGVPLLHGFVSVRRSEIRVLQRESADSEVSRCASRACRKARPRPAWRAVPAGATSFGPRSAMLEEGHKRIWSEPDKYVHSIWGEQEAGGTSWLYLSAVPFEEIGLRTDVGNEAYPVLTKEFLYAVPFVLTLVPPLLLGVSEATKRRGSDPEEEA